ncbi:MAG TPA: LPS-assembly protein LptD [Desulfuromonadales bacterium]|nr:LPS-assembly protein LptD [Desulfuromonadales bacterium]
MTRILTLVMVVLLLVAPSRSFGAEQQIDDDAVRITADSMEHSREDGVITARDNVLVTWKGGTLRAESARYDSVARVLHASGNVRIARGNDGIIGDAVRMNLDDGRADIDNAMLSVPASSITLKGEKLTRLSESNYEGERSEFTTCDWPDPSWKFGVNSLKVDLMGYATGRHVLFYIKGVPVLYFPWIAFPASTEKRSGILFPRIGYSNGRGARLDVPFYWVISPSQDLQVDLDLLSRRGVGTGFDYRYLRTRGSEGHLGGYQIYDQLQDRWRWQIGQSHREIFSADANLRMDVNLTGDRTFLADYGEKSGDYNRQSTDTIVNALKTWHNFALTAHLKYAEDLYSPDNSQVVQTLPVIGLSGVRLPLPLLPLYFDVDADLANFYRETPASGQRLHLFPRLSTYRTFGGWLHASVFSGLHLRGYATGRKADGNAQGADGDLLPETGARLTTSLYRIYDVGGADLVKVRHELVPEITYGFLPERSQQRLPLYDVVDRMAWRNMVGVALTSMLNGKFAVGETSEYRDISRIRLLMGYSFEGGRQDLLTQVDTQRPWTDLIIESDTWLGKSVRLNADARFNVYDRQISSVALGLEADDRQGSSAGVGYQKARGDAEYFEARLATSRLKPVTLTYAARYSFDKGDFLEAVYSAEYRHKCWSVNAAFTQRPGNHSFTFNFNLAGLTAR